MHFHGTRIDYGAFQGMRRRNDMNTSYTSLFIDLAKYSAITALVVVGFVTTAAIASSQNIQAPTAAQMKVISAQMAIKSPSVNACPANATMAGWIHTSKPGKVSYMIAKKGGSVSGPFTANAVESVNGGLATIGKQFQVHQAIDTEYRILVPNGNAPVMSNWVPLKASCKIQLGG